MTMLLWAYSGTLSRLKGTVFGVIYRVFYDYGQKLSLCLLYHYLELERKKIVKSNERKATKLRLKSQNSTRVAILIS